MEILEAFDLTGTLRGAAELVGCDHKTVAHWVAARDEAGGGLPVAVRPRPRVDAFAEKIEEWVDRSRGTHPRGRRASAAAGDGLSGLRAHDAAGGRGGQAPAGGPEHGRRFRPWTAEPGLWMQWDYGDGPKVAGRSTVLFCAWLAVVAGSASCSPLCGSDDAVAWSWRSIGRCGRSAARRPTR